MQKKSSSQPRALCANAADATERAAEVRERVFRYYGHNHYIARDTAEKKIYERTQQQKETTQP